MKYASIDVETTGLDPNVHKIIEVAAIIGNTKDNETPICKLPSYSSVIYQDPLTWSTYCIGLHTENGLIKDLFTCKDQTPDKVFRELSKFLNEHLGKPQWNIAGKNPNFDVSFLKQLGEFPFRHRVIDPAVFYYEPGDDKLPDLSKCLERAKLQPDVAHRALCDAACVIQLLREQL